jgi:hypothetical protein
MSRRPGSLLLLALVLATGAAPARANLGETLAQCTARYGPPTTEKVTDSDPTRPAGKMNLIFKANGCMIIIAFLHGIAGTEGFIKIDQTDFTDRELADLLRAESDGLGWTPGRPGIQPNPLRPGMDYWTRTDGATATYAPGRHGRSGFIFESKAFDNALNPAPHTFIPPPAPK